MIYKSRIINREYARRMDSFVSGIVSVRGNSTGGICQAFHNEQANFKGRLTQAPYPCSSL